MARKPKDCIYFWFSEPVQVVVKQAGSAQRAFMDRAGTGLTPSRHFTPLRQGASWRQPFSKSASYLASILTDGNFAIAVTE
jgi:hypothetical protein